MQKPNPMPPLPLLNASQFASLVEVTVESVSAWADAGMPCQRSGRQGSPMTIDLAAALPWVVRRFLNRAESPRQRLYRAKAEKLEYENAIRRAAITRAG